MKYKPVKVLPDKLRDVLIVPRGGTFEVWHKGQKVKTYSSYDDALMGAVALAPEKFRKNPAGKLEPFHSGRRPGYQNVNRAYLRKLGLRGDVLERVISRQLNGMTLADAYHAEKGYGTLPAETENPFRHERIVSASALRRKGLTKYRSVITPRGNVLRIAFPKGKRKTGSGRLQSILHKTNPPATMIYSRCLEIAGSKAGMPHKCDAECKHYGHKYRHKFSHKCCIYGLPDGSILIK